MGSGSSVNEKVVRADWMAVFLSMQLTKPEVMKLHKIYTTIDTNNSGTIEVSELLSFMGVERTDFTERMFAAFDKDGSERLDFYEFVVSLWKFCTLGNGSISVFCFDLYDFDGDGILSFEELDRLFHDLYWYGSKGVETEAQAQKKVLADLIAHSPREEVHIEEFKPFCRTHQALLMPVHSLQSKLRKAVLGSSFWDSLSQRKIQLKEGMSIPLSELMVLHSDRKMFRSMLEDHSTHGLSDMMRVVLENTDCQHVLTPDNSQVVEKKSSASAALYSKFARKKQMEPAGNTVKTGVLVSVDLMNAMNDNASVYSMATTVTTGSSTLGAGSISTRSSGSFWLNPSSGSSHGGRDHGSVANNLAAGTAVCAKHAPHANDPPAHGHHHGHHHHHKHGSHSNHGSDKTDESAGSLLSSSEQHALHAASAPSLMTLVSPRTAAAQAGTSGHHHHHSFLHHPAHEKHHHGGHIHSSEAGHHHFHHLNKHGHSHARHHSISGPAN